MQIEKNAVAGTLESSDALVTVEPAQQGIELEISSRGSQTGHHPANPCFLGGCSGLDCHALF